MGEGGGRTLALFRFHLSPFPPETPDTQANSLRTADAYPSSLLSLRKREKRRPEMRLLFTGYGEHGTKELLGVAGSKL